MADFQVRNKLWTRTLDPSGKLYDLITSLEEEISNLKSQTAASGSQAPATPQAPSALTVSASGGIFQINITPSQQGVNHVIEYSPQQSFAQPRQIFLGAGVTSERRNLGASALFFRVRAGLPTAPHASPLSDPTYFGSASVPTPVIGGGATIGPPV